MESLSFLFLKSHHFGKCSYLILPFIIRYYNISCRPNDPRDPSSPRCGGRDPLKPPVLTPMAFWTTPLTLHDACELACVMGFKCRFRTVEMMIFRASHKRLQVSLMVLNVIKKKHKKNNLNNITIGESPVDRSCMHLKPSQPSSYSELTNDRHALSS